MSTIDPAELRRARSERLRGSTGAACVVAVAAVLLVVAGAAAGLALAALLDQERITQLNSPLSSSSSDSWILFPAVVVPTAVVGSMIAFPLYGWANRRYLGRKRYVGLGPAPFWMAGAIIGAWYGCMNWTKPEKVGVRRFPDLLIGDQKWDTGDWIFYHARWWLPSLVTVIGLLTLLGSIGAQSLHRRRDELITSLLTSGRLTPGTVTETVDPATESSKVAGKWTVKFTDLRGQDRWVTRLGTFPAASRPAVGETVTVLYDPQAPGDEKRIFVARGDFGAKDLVVDDFTATGI